MLLDSLGLANYYREDLENASVYHVSMPIIKKYSRIKAVQNHNYLLAKVVYLKSNHFKKQCSSSSFY